MEKFENAALFLRLGLPSTLIRHENRESFLKEKAFEKLFRKAFPKRSSNQSNLKTPALRFKVVRKNFENRAFQNKLSYDDHVISLPGDLLKHKSKMLRSQIFLVCTVAENFDAYSEAVKTPF